MDTSSQQCIGQLVSDTTETRYLTVVQSADFQQLLYILKAIPDTIACDDNSSACLRNFDLQIIGSVSKLEQDDPEILLPPRLLLVVDA